MNGDMIVHVQIDIQRLISVLERWRMEILQVEPVTTNYAADVIPELVNHAIYHHAQQSVPKGDFNFNDIPGDMEDVDAMS